MDNNFLNWLENETNESVTANGAKAYKTTKSDVLDFFSKISTYRDNSEYNIIKAFSKAYAEDKELALKALFYMRDVRGGQGERRAFRICLKHLATLDAEWVMINLTLIAEYGRWDDLFVLLEVDNKKLKDMVIIFIGLVLVADMNSDKPSLLAKWLPSENASSKKTKTLARTIREGLRIDSKTYRQLLSALRKRINILECKMSAKDWTAIEYDKIPSQAGLKYRNAFKRNDEERYTEFIEKLSKGEKKVNSSTLYPYQLITKVREEFRGYMQGTKENRNLYDSMWKALPDYVEGNKLNAICVVDTSGSMESTYDNSKTSAMDVALSLGLYVAERTEGIFKNHFITFSDNPTLQKVNGVDLVEKINNMERAKWGMTTNIEAVFDLLLKTVVANNGTQADMPEQVIIISDMQFNRCARINGIRGDSSDPKLFDHIAKKFADAGFKLPKLIFWDASNDDYGNTFPMIENENGLGLVSGCSPSILKAVLNNKFLTPYELMLQVLESERYASIKL